MADDLDGDVLNEFRDTVIHPACVEFASRIGANEPQRYDEGECSGSIIHMPKSFQGAQLSQFVVCLEPFDEHAFVVKATRPDEGMPLRKVALVRYDSIDGATGSSTTAHQVVAQLSDAFEQIRQHISQDISDQS